MTNTHSKRGQPRPHFIFILPLHEPGGVDLMQKSLTLRQKVLSRKDRKGEEKLEMRERKSKEGKGRRR